VGVAETTNVGIIERRLRDTKHAPEADPGIDEEDLGGLVKRKGIETVTVATLAPEEVTDQLQLASSERGVCPSEVIAHLRDGVGAGHVPKAGYRYFADMRT
jgi:hypothetical protein